MGGSTNRSGATARNPVFTALADRRRRHVLALLLDRASPVTEDDLATHVAARERDVSLLEVTDEDARAVRKDLSHVQLPTLEDAGLLRRQETASTVTTTDHPVFEDPKFERILETEANDWDAVLANLAHKRRRIVLSVLKDRESPVAIDVLAREVLVYETDEEEFHSEAIEDLNVSLHHVHLPKLAAAGLIAYDPTSRTTTYEGHPALNEEWLDFQSRDTPRAILAIAERSEEIWRIEGRDNVTERGRALCDYAEEELFMMFTAEGLVERACLRRIQDAIDRGVDVYLGTQTQELRDLAREEVPEMTLWEPRMDWLNLPPTREKVGRLVLADREAIMLGTLGEKTDKGVHEETAITGTGENNALVVLLRELLGSRLDHLDEQSEDFLSEIPL